MALTVHHAARDLDQTKDFTKRLVSTINKLGETKSTINLRKNNTTMRLFFAIFLTIVSTLPAIGAEARFIEVTNHQEDLELERRENTISSAGGKLSDGRVVRIVLDPKGDKLLQPDGSTIEIPDDVFCALVLIDFIPGFGGPIGAVDQPDWCSAINISLSDIGADDALALLRADERARERAIITGSMHVGHGDHEQDPFADVVIKVHPDGDRIVVDGVERLITAEDLCRLFDVKLKTGGPSWMIHLPNGTCPNRLNIVAQ